MSESPGTKGDRVIWRIAIASVLVVSLIGAVLVATVFSYRSALAAHELSADSIREQSNSHVAETFLAREREAMNEYLLHPRQSVRAEIRTYAAAFRTNISKIGADEPLERRLVQRAIDANDQFIVAFEQSARGSARSVEALRFVELQLDAGEDGVLWPLRDLHASNERYSHNAERNSEAASRHAILFAIFAGALAISGGLAFAFYAARLVRAIGSRNKRLHELDRVKDDFVASVSHELRTPLTSIRGYLELLRDGEAGALNEDQHHFVSIVERNADRLLRLVGDLLFFAKEQAGTITLELGLTDVDKLVHQAVDAASPAAAERGIALDIDLDHDAMGELYADRARLDQVLDNLISNALKFTPAGGNVIVRTSRRPGAVLVIEVCDDGMGMSEEDQDRLFQRFFRTSSATDQAIQGTGLGLAIVKAIIEAHDGTISVESAQGEGTVFRVELPLARELVAA